MATTLDSDVVQILVNCGCAQHVMKFAGLTIEKLSLYTRDDLARLLPADGDQDELAQKVEEEVQKVKLQKESQEQNEEEDDEVEILDVITRTEGTLVIVKEEIIDDDDDEKVDPQGVNGEGTLKKEEIIDDGSQQNGPSTVTSIEEISLKNEVGDDSNWTTKEEESSDEDNDVQTEPIILNPKNLADGFKNLQRMKHARVQILGGYIGLVHNCKWSHPHPTILEQWTDGMTQWGSNIRSVKIIKWTWSGMKSQCPWNLFTILTQQCPLITELIIESNIIRHFRDSDDDEAIPHFPVDFRLSKLRILRIDHEGDLDYAKELEQILLAADKLREIDFSFGTPQAANSFLTILRNLKGAQLKSLKTLTIKSYDETGYLQEAQLVKLAKVEAISLEELELGHGLWEDVEGPTIQEILYRFQPTLKAIKILGCFQGRSQVKPSILINFPSMWHLEYINLGGNYVYDSVFEDSLPLSDDSSPSKIRKTVQGQRIHDPVVSDVEQFPVTLQFSLLPKLEHLELGIFFHIKDLHFATFPKLTRFFVTSPWNLSVIFPPENKSRRSSYPLITDLQLPDCLDDPYFVKLIPNRFPNLEYCIIDLATVTVLRTFFSSMANSNLEELRLRTRFDFASTLDTCLLDKPTEVKLSLDELTKIRLLKTYSWWGEFIKFHKIQLPPENLSSLEGEGLAGLSSLKKLKKLYLGHRARTLRIPKSQLHWADPNCQFTGSFIGFREYPWSIECEKLRSALMKKSLQDDFYMNYHVPFRPTKMPKLMANSFPVQPCSNLAEGVKDEKI